MSSCFIKRVLPFALAFLCGVAVWQSIKAGSRASCVVSYPEHVSRSWPGERGTWAYARPDAEESRTWLVIHSPHPAVLARRGSRGCDGCSVRMRVLFGENGEAVPGTAFSLTPSSYPVLDDAVRAARSIVFAPATRNGRPIPIWANATYACDPEHVRPLMPESLRCGLTVDKNSARTWDGKPWRVVTPHE
ncbi:MAG TPA: hypothetical protein VF064_00980 [Pyrinomonadaceae bacterium]